MKNNTKIRLHLSKNLFESLAKQVVAEAKKGDMSGGAYTEAVKAPKAYKEKAPKAEKEGGIKEMETRVAEDVDKEIAALRKQLEDMPDIADMSDEDKKKADEINKKLRSLKAKKGIEEGPINENEAAAVQDLMQFLQDNAGFLAGVGGIVGAAKWIASQVAKNPEARKTLDKATGAGSSDLGPFGGKSFGKK